MHRLSEPMARALFKVARLEKDYASAEGRALMVLRGHVLHERPVEIGGTMLVVSCVHHGSLDALARRGLLHVERFVDRCYRGRPWHRRAARLTKKGRAEVARLTLEEDALAEHLEADKW